jgi:hypothetical protein
VSTLHLPAVARNPVSLLGMAMATAMAIVFLALFLLDLAGYLTNPYIGLLVFVTIPALFVVGLLLIPFGAWWSARRRLRRPGAEEWPVVDLRKPHHRRVLAAVFVLTVVNLVIVSFGAYGGVHYMESTEFCGQVCHTTMEPQAVGHGAWPHSAVSCTQCHVGPGAGAFVEAKLAGARQLLHVVTNQVPRPVPSPSDPSQSGAVTCVQCHASGARVGDRPREIREYASDEANTELLTTLRLHVGDRSAGIHRHIGLDIEYVAEDDTRASIPVVRVRDESGAVREFVMEGAPGTPASGVTRRMGCTDCHSRPAHTFSFTPERAVDRAIARGVIPRELPFVRREAVAAVSEDAGSREAALSAIARRLEMFYASREGTDAALVARAIAGARDVWTHNVFPDMRVTWGTYPNHLGHVDTPGCFRCHDDSHTAADGSAITQECELCHTNPD